MKKCAAVILLAVLLLSSCADVSETASLVILYDNSRSTVEKHNKVTNQIEDMRAGYLPASRQIISKVGPGTVIQGAVITAQSLRVPAIAISGELPRYRPLWDNQIIFKSELLKKKQEIMAQIERTISNKGGSQSTCLIDAVLLAQQFFAGNKTTKKTLVIFSDMLEECGPVQFGGQGNLPRDEAGINKLLVDLEGQQKVPDLHGVQVLIYGATGGDGSEDTSSRFILVSNFWKAFFARAGAEIREYGTFVRYPFTSASIANVELPSDKLQTSVSAAPQPQN